MLIQLIAILIKLSYVIACMLTLFIAYLQLKKNENWKKFKKWAYLSYSIPIILYFVISLGLQILN